MRAFNLLVLVAATALLAGTPAWAQKGTGEPTGVARQAEKPAVEEMAGTVDEVNVGACENTTGRSEIGAHLFVDVDGKGMVNLHLGPLNAVDHVLEQVPAGTEISFAAFRTEAMPANAYVAQTITVDDKVITLRDANLRPSWAAARGPGGGMGSGMGMGPGGGQGRGQGQGMGSGGGQGMGQGMGQGQGGGRGGGCWW